MRARIVALIAVALIVTGCTSAPTTEALAPATVPTPADEARYVTGFRAIFPTQTADMTDSYVLEGGLQLCDKFATHGHAEYRALLLSEAADDRTEVAMSRMLDLAENTLCPSP